MTDMQVLTRRWPWRGWLVVAGSTRAFHPEPPWLADMLVEKTDPALGALWIDPEVTLREGERMTVEIEPLLSSPIERLGPEEPVPETGAGVGLILLTGREIRPWLDNLGSATVGRWISDRLESGTVLFASGAAAAVLGERVFSGVLQDEGCQGVAWLPGAVILPGVRDPAELPQVKKYLSETPRSYALGLIEETAVAFGPQGQIEVWVGDPPKIVLGRGWIPG